VINSVNETKEILVIGPGSAKLELIKHAHHHDPKIAANIVGVETVDHPSDKEILAYARKFFYKADQML
jgi:NADH dehydrogenase FAD-containing subunit